MSYQLTSSLRVLQLGSPTGLYGAERWILALIRNLDPQKVKSIVGVIRDEPGIEPPLCTEAANQGFETIMFDAYGKASISAVVQLRRYIIQQKIQILHTHWYKTDILGYFATIGTDCKIVSTPHGWTQKPDLKLFIYEVLDRGIFSVLGAVVPLSKEIYNSLIRNPFLKKKLHLIENGVDLTEIKSSNAVAPQLLEWKKGGYFIIGYIGRLVKGKDLDTLIKATAMLQNIKFKIAVIGEGDQLGHLTNLAKQHDIDNHITFFGYRKNRLDYLRGFDVFVLPSLSEGVPRCLMEAMGAKVLVIASDIPGCKVLVKNNENGFLFNVGNETCLSKKLHYAYKNKNKSHFFIRKAETTITEKYSALRMANKYEHLFEALCKEKNGLS